MTSQSAVRPSSLSKPLLEPVVIHEGIAYVSGQLPRRDGKLVYTGKLGTDLALAEGEAAARLCAEAALTALSEAVGGPSNIVRILKLLGFVASGPGFGQQGAVINGASAYLHEALGERGRHARSAIGVAELPHNGAVEIELVAAVRA